MSRNYTLHFLSILLLQLCSLTLAAQPESGITLDGLHYSQACNRPLQSAPPIVLGYDPQEYQLTHKDKRHQLGCTVSGFKGYFSFPNWENDQKQGDDGVDVTGAPNPVLVEGANSASIILVPGSKASFGIVLPADGFIMFDWGYIGGSPFSNQQFAIYINGEKVDQLDPDHMAGTYLSKGLDAGDTLRIKASAAMEGFEIRLSQFEFVSNAASVVERRWEATAKDGSTGSFTQWVTLEKPDFTQLIFPDHYDGVTQPKLNQYSGSAPQFTGFPAVDVDGDWATTYDQTLLDQERFGLQATWEDEAIFDGRQCIIYRHWTVRDLCGENVQMKTQIIIMDGACPSTTPSWLPVQRVDQEKFSQPNIPPHIELQTISYTEAWQQPYHLPAEELFFP
jgi:hypothetical protein